MEATWWGTFQVSWGSRVLAESGVFKPSVEWVCTCVEKELCCRWTGGSSLTDSFFIHFFYNRLASLNKTSCCRNKWPLTLRGKWRAEPRAPWAGVWSLHCSGLCILHTARTTLLCFCLLDLSWWTKLRAFRLETNGNGMLIKDPFEYSRNTSNVRVDCWIQMSLL